MIQYIYRLWKEIRDTYCYVHIQSSISTKALKQKGRLDSHSIQKVQYVKEKKARAISHLQYENKRYEI